MAAPNESYTTQQQNGGYFFQGTDGEEHFIKESKYGNGLQFELREGDEVSISADGQLATLVVNDGTKLMQFDTPHVEGAEHASFFTMTIRSQLFL